MLTSNINNIITRNLIYALIYPFFAINLISLIFINMSVHPVRVAPSRSRGMQLRSCRWMIIRKEGQQY